MKKLMFFLILFSFGLLSHLLPVDANEFFVPGQGQPVGNRRQISRSEGVSSFSVPGSSDGIETGKDQVSELYNRLAAARGGVDAYQVHILGQVENPGTYRFPPSVRLEEAILFAGGVRNRGSTRKIELRRKDGIVYYDIFRFKSFGALSQNPFLLNNDVIFVPHGEDFIIVNGPVKNPGTYEMLPQEKTIAGLVSLAGGFTSGISLSTPITVIRYADAEKQLFEVKNTPEDMKAFALERGDTVIFPHLLTKGASFDYNVSSLPADNLFYPSFNDNVFIVGSVALPGGYRFNPHFSVRDFVFLAGPQVNSNLKRTFILTAKGEKITRKEFGQHRLSPGDTIVVPSRAWTTDNVIKWYNTVTSSLLTGAAVYTVVK